MAHALSLQGYNRRTTEEEEGRSVCAFLQHIWLEPNRIFALGI